MEVMIGQCMPNRLRFVRLRQVLFGYVGGVNSLIDQNMVPRLVFRGAGSGRLVHTIRQSRRRPGPRRTQRLSNRTARAE